MTLKKIYEKFDINIERILIKKHREMNLTTPEMVILLVLLEMIKKKPVFSIQSIMKRLDYSQKEIGEHINKLIDKGYLNIYHEETKQGKVQELFDLDTLFKKIEEINEDDKPISGQQITNIQSIVMLLEEYLNRVLYPKELQQLRHLIDEEQYEIEQIKDIILDLKDKVTLFKIQRLLSIQDKLPKHKTDSNKDAALDALFKSIK
jgi:DNA replication protein DnaD